ncbi:hypothetical protein [Nocardia rhizosphaerihabitans]|uniref:PPE family domain-containing protein n=1 Tax=Nocardia rhizosphaerihabitans TaxID=1691570 RepID=A0ABQ2KKK4_9NOCA|nr:hypothetical protein [Nocardia rhizosphaerihabitans]GGN85938.1 hypothetical protein GCM10011610_40710 [Nocardia rhizosphaerihabitans]
MTFPGGAPSGGVALDPTVLELLRGSAMAPLLDQPVSQALSSMGLPQLPQLPQFVQLPEMPPLPTIDLTALMQPLTQLASAFGTGQLGGTGADPTEMLSNVSSVLSTMMSLGSTALQTVMSLWQSAAASEAATKATAAQADGAKLAAQSTQEKAVLAGAAGNVAVGAAKLGAVIARYSATVALAPLYAMTPVGQGVLVAATIEAMTEALAITAETKIELVGRSAEMTTAGEKVQVTNAPTGVDSSSESLSQLMSMITPLISTATTAASSLGSLAEQVTSLSTTNTTGTTTTDTATTGEAISAEDAAAGAGLGGGGGMGAIGGVGAVAAAATPLSPWQGGRGSGMSTVGLGGMASAAPATGSTASTATSSTAPGYMPMGAGGAGAPMARAVDGGGNEAVHTQLVTGHHGDEVVGQIDGVSMPVVGGAEPVTTEAPPDKELTL